MHSDDHVLAVLHQKYIAVCHDYESTKRSIDSLQYLSLPDNELERARGMADELFNIRKRMLDTLINRMKRSHCSYEIILFSERDKLSREICNMSRRLRIARLKHIQCTINELNPQLIICTENLNLHDSIIRQLVCSLYY